MKIQSIFFTFVAMIAAGGQASPEPRYEGRLLSDWLKDVRHSSPHLPTPLTKEAELAVAHIGTNAIPLLLSWMRKPDASVFDGTIAAFEVLGATARSAIPELAQLAIDQAATGVNPEEIGSGSVAMLDIRPLLALGRIGPEALPVLLRWHETGHDPGQGTGRRRLQQDPERSAGYRRPPDDHVG